MDAKEKDEGAQGERAEEPLPVVASHDEDEPEEVTVALENRLEDLRVIAQQSRASLVAPPPETPAEVEIPLSVRNDILRASDLIPSVTRPPARPRRKTRALTWPRVALSAGIGAVAAWFLASIGLGGAPRAPAPTAALPAPAGTSETLGRADESPPFTPAVPTAAETARSTPDPDPEAAAAGPSSAAAEETKNERAKAAVDEPAKSERAKAAADPPAKDAPAKTATDEPAKNERTKAAANDQARNERAKTVADPYEAGRPPTKPGEETAAASDPAPPPASTDAGAAAPSAPSAADSGSLLHAMADAVGTAAPAAKDAPAEASGEVPFNRPAALSAVRGVAMGLVSCKTQPSDTGRGAVSITFLPSGGVSQVVLDGGPFTGTATGNCIVRLFRTARVPAFSGSTVVVRRSFSLE